MFVGSLSDDYCSMLDGDYSSYQTSTGRSISSKGLPETCLLSPPLRVAMDNLPMQHSKDQMRAKKGETKTFSRVHGVCTPCKLAKIKCDRAIPCGSCRSEKRKPRTCVYSEKAQKIARARQEGEALRLYRHGSGSTEPEEFEPHEHHVPNAISHSFAPSQKVPYISTSSGLMHRKLSLRKVVDEFIEVKRFKGVRHSAQLQIHNVQSSWADLQELLFKERESTSTVPLQATQCKVSPAVADCERADEFGGILDRRRTQLNDINEQICNGNLANAWFRIPPLMRAMEIGDIPYEEDPYQCVDVRYHEVTSTYGRLLELDSTLSFFFGSHSSLSPAWQRSNPLRSTTEHSIDTKIEVFRKISQVLEIDTSDEPGVKHFLQFHRSIKIANPATTLEKVAIGTTDKEPFEAQELKLFSNLLFVLIHCRTASICNHYSRPDCPLPPENTGIGEIVRDMKVNEPKQRGLECAGAIKHAGNVIDAFEALYEIDKESLAKSWLLLYGGLTATVLYQINGLRGKGGDWEACKETIDRIRDRFADLKEIGSTSAPFDKAIAVLMERNPPKPQASGTPKAESRPSLTHGMGTQACDEGNEVSERPQKSKSVVGQKPQPRRKRNIDEVARSSPSARSKTSRIIHYEVRDLASANSSFDGYDQSVETRHGFEYGDTLPFQASQYDSGFGTDFDGHASFASGATTSSAAAVPQQVNMFTSQPPPAPPSLSWEAPAPQGYWHPPLAFPHEWVQNGLPTEFGTDHLQILEDTMPASAPRRSFLPSPAHEQRVTAVEHMPGASASENSNFYRTPPQKLEERRAEHVGSGPARSSNSRMRRPSQPILSLGESVVAPRHWHEGQEQDTMQILGPEYHPPMLPPRPEMMWLQSDQGAYHAIHEPRYRNHHETSYAIGDSEMAGHDNMHQMPQQHNHYYQSTTMS